MNADQIKSIATTLLAVVGGFFVGNGTFTSEQWSSLTNNILIAVPALVSVGALVFKALQHTDSAKVAAAAQVPGVQEINVDPTKASPGAAAAAASPTLPNVVPTKVAA